MAEASFCQEELAGLDFLAGAKLGATQCRKCWSLTCPRPRKLESRRAFCKWRLLRIQAHVTNDAFEPSIEVGLAERDVSGNIHAHGSPPQGRLPLTIRLISISADIAMGVGHFSAFAGGPAV